MRETTIYLVRHGSLPSRCDGRFLGRTDVPLSSKGRAEAKRLEAVFGGGRGLAVWSSPSRRCRATARLAAPGADGHPRIVSDLRETDFGRWEGLSFDEIQRLDPRGVARWAAFRPDFRFPGGESLRSFCARVKKMAEVLSKNPAKNVLVVTHGGVIRALVCLWSGKPLNRYPEVRVPPGSISTVRVRAGRPRVVSVGRTP